MTGFWAYEEQMPYQSTNNLHIPFWLVDLRLNKRAIVFQIEKDQSEHEDFSIKPSKHCKWIGRFSWSSFSQRFHIIFFFFSLYRVAHLFWNQTALFLGKYFIYLKKISKIISLKHRLIKFIKYKVHIFWEGHKILWNVHQFFVLCIYCQSNNWWRFRRIVWPSQNIWTLTTQPYYL